MVAVLPVEQPQIVVGVVEHCLHRRIREHLSQRGQVLHRERVHHRRLLAGADLQQIDPVGESVKARRLRIHCEQRRAAESREQRFQLRLRLDQRYAGAHSVFDNCSRPAAISSSALDSAL